MGKEDIYWNNAKETKHEDIFVIFFLPIKQNVTVSTSKNMINTETVMPGSIQQFCLRATAKQQSFVPGLL